MRKTSYLLFQVVTYTQLSLAHKLRILGMCCGDTFDKRIKVSHAIIAHEFLL